VAAAALAFGAGIAQADVNVAASVFKTKTKTVTETINVTKTVNVNVVEDIQVDAVSETEVVKNQRNQFNYVQDEDTLSTAEINGAEDSEGSFNDASGILLVNQSPGFINNQANDVSVTHANEQSFEGGVFAHSQVAVEQINGWHPPDVGEDGTITVTTPPDLDQDGFPDFVNTYALVSDGTTHTDTIGSSFNGASGIAGVNQSAGSMNNQNNAVGIALGDFAVFSLGETDLGQFNTYNSANILAGLSNFDTISGSFNEFNGVAAVNQSAGALNNQANAVSIAVSLQGLPPSMGIAVGTVE
jgi:hypothetical protein